MKKMSSPGIKSIDVVCSGMKNDRMTPMMIVVIERMLKVFSYFMGADVLMVCATCFCLTMVVVRKGSISSHIMKIQVLSTPVENSGMIFIGNS